MNQTSKNEKKPLILGPIFAHLAKITPPPPLPPQFFLSVLRLLVVRHCYYPMQFKEKLMNQT